jgi:hypothetical protein
VASPINVPNPVALPTPVQLAQVAANIAGTMATNIRSGNYEDVYQAILDLAAAINCLAQGQLVVNNTTPSTVGSVTVRNAFALGASAVIPATITTSAV